MSTSTGNEAAQTGRLTVSSIDQLTLSYLRGDISFQEYETMIENQHLLAIAHSANSASTVSGLSSIGNDQSYLVSNIVELTTEPDSRAPNAILDRFFSLRDILDDEDDNQVDELTKDAASVDQITMSGDESHWNDFDIETLNFDKFIKDHQLSKDDKEVKQKSSKRKRDFDQSNETGAASSSVRSEDPNELKAKRRRNRMLPVEIQGLMGQANLSYARGDTNKAIDTCLEVIKYAPNAPEPFQLLAMLYSEQGQNAKSLRVGLVAAQLNRDPQEWEELIQQAIIEGDINIVLFCYNNAIQCDLTNVRLHLGRIRVLEEKSDTRRLMLAKLMLLKYVDVNSEALVDTGSGFLDGLAIYQKYFDELMSELRDDESGDRTKKIYLLKNDMKKFKEKFSLKSMIKSIYSLYPSA